MADRKIIFGYNFVVPLRIVYTLKNCTNLYVKLSSPVHQDFKSPGEKCKKLSTHAKIYNLLKNDLPNFPQ